MPRTKTIDYLTEDRPIPGQKYALISIVGPNYKQNCDIYGIKIRGFASTEGEAKKLTQSIMKYDNNFDIYTAPVGLFFPLDVDPSKVKNVEYANSQLNDLIKNYTENRVEADNQFHIRKQEMIKEAIKEGKNQEEMSTKPEHPVSVLGRINEFSNKITDYLDKIEALKQDQELAEQKFQSYTKQEQEEAKTIIENGINQELQNKDNEQKDRKELEQVVVETITSEFKESKTCSLEELQKDLSRFLEETTPIETTLESLEKIKHQIQDINDALQLINPEQQPSTYHLLSTEKQKLLQQKQTLVETLNTSDTTKFINTQFGDTDNTQLLNQSHTLVTPSQSWADI